MSDTSVYQEVWVQSSLKPNQPKMIKKVLVCSLVILIILVITNPTNSDFKSFVAGKAPETLIQSDCGRTQYFGVFSTYESNIKRYGEQDEHAKYIGIFKNFILIEP